MIWKVENKVTHKVDTWYPKDTIDKIKNFCVEAQDNTGAIIFKMIEESEK